MTSDLKAAIVCLETEVQLKYASSKRRPIPPQACQLIVLHFIVIKGQVHALPPISVVDTDTGIETVIRESLNIYVQ
jgi:hypothetical protein